ncbi:MAG: hypothetical protein EOL89_09160 [Actinobacteria bacterium]|nr:hypothetical protein [Actinomycetota bacterium]
MIGLKDLAQIGQPTGGVKTLLDHDYLERLATALERSVGSGLNTTITELLRSGRGATPEIILGWLSGTFGSAHIPSATLPPDSAPEPIPELHPLLFEWYFDAPSVKFVTTLISGEADDVLCLGAPTVANDLCRQSQVHSVTLVDADSGIPRRFPCLDRNSLHLGELDSFRPNRTFTVTVADPPWYLADALRWLKIARRLTRDGGSIVMPLFPELTRPGADRERDTVLQAARTIGRTDLYPASLVYRTPQFEEATLRALGITSTGDWRSADLLVVRDLNGAAEWEEPRGAHRGIDGWRHYTVGTQVVMLRETPTVDNSDSVFVPIPGCPNNTLTSVSGRDPRRELIGIWTSRNKVASVGDVSHAAALLESINHSADALSIGDGSSAFLFLRELLRER